MKPKKTAKEVDSEDNGWQIVSGEKDPGQMRFETYSPEEYSSIKDYFVKKETVDLKKTPTELTADTMSTTFTMENSPPQTPSASPNPPQESLKEKVRSFTKNPLQQTPSLNLD
ncbi:MAG: hypothetical protein ACJA02_000925 [Myxococcota bacterium]|jgi:hypothetical protein